MVNGEEVSYIILGPIELDRLLRDGAAAGAFLDYLRSPRARAIIGAAGYRLPESR